MLTPTRSFDSTSSRLRIFDSLPHFSKLDDNSEDDLDENAFIHYKSFNRQTISINNKGYDDLHEWLITSYYGSVQQKQEEHIVPVEYPKLDQFLEEEGPTDETSESNSLLQKEKSQIDIESSTMNTYDYGLCKSCKSRYTRSRTTRWTRIIWLLLTSLFLSIALFPWGLFSILCLILIPYQVRRPMCKRCRNSSILPF